MNREAFRMDEIYVTPQRPPITDFDGLPFPDGSLIDYEKYNRYIGQALVKNTVYLQATRGCPYDCLYCFGIWPKKHVFRSAENLFAEVKLYYDLGVHRFSFIDDIFNLNIKNSLKFFEMIIKSGLDVYLFFPAGLRGDILTKEYLDLMIEAGTINFALALETASPRLQKLIKKNLNIEKLHENIEYICSKYPQVILELFTMHGFPTETKEEALKTLDFIKSIKWLHFPYVNVLRIYPNTGMEKLALEKGISAEAIYNSENLSYNELPETLPFDKGFTFDYQAQCLHGYFLRKDRLLHVLPYQMKVLTRDELVQKYDSYLPVPIRSFDDILRAAGITKNQLETTGFLDENEVYVPGFNEKLGECFGRNVKKESSKDPLGILLLDLSQGFSDASEHMRYDVGGIPLGLMYLLTTINRRFGNRIKGKIAKSRIDFDSFTRLKTLLGEFQPDIIGVRTLTVFKNFFHDAVAVIKEWQPGVPVVAGGPYATSDYKTVLQDRNIDLVVLGEGEVTFSALVDEFMKNGRKLPAENILKKIAGIAFAPVNLKAVVEKNTILSQFNENLEDE